MIIWVYGEDTFRSRQKLKDLIAKFKQKFDTGGLNLIVFKEKWEPDELIQAVSSAPFLAPKKMVIVENLASRIKEKDIQAMAGYWAKIPESTILVFWEEENKPLEKFFSAMPKKDVFYYKYELLSSDEIKKWLMAKAKEKNLDIDARTLDLLFNKVGYDLWCLNSEMDKLGARAAGAKITAEHMGELIDTKLEDNVFIFCNLIAQRKTSRALQALEELLKSGLSEGEIMNKLVWQLKVLLKVKSYFEDNAAPAEQSAAKELGLHPFVVKKARPLLKGFETGALKNIYQKTLELDQDIKLGRVQAKLGLELLVSQI